MKPLDEDTKVGDKVILQDGREGRVIATDIKGESPIIIALPYDDGKQEKVISVYENGKYNRQTKSYYDVFKAPSKQKLFINIYKGDIGIFATIHKNIDKADSCSNDYRCKRLACIEYEIEEEYYK